MKNNVIVGELINEDSLLVIDKNQKVYVNYLDAENNKFKQSYIGKLGKDSIEFGFNSIAVFTPSASKISLKKIYDLNTHEFVKDSSKYEFYTSRFILKYPTKSKKM